METICPDTAAVWARRLPVGAMCAAGGGAGSGGGVGNELVVLVVWEEVFIMSAPHYTGNKVSSGRRQGREATCALDTCCANPPVPTVHVVRCDTLAFCSCVEEVGGTRS